MSEVCDFKKWNEHQGKCVAQSNGFDIIDCECCGFKHMIPLVSADELKETYEHDYYSEEKPLYMERHREDKEWWKIVYDERYEWLENNLASKQRKLLDIGSGPGFFLMRGKERGWTVKGIEPSRQAWQHSVKELGLDVINDFFSEKNADSLGRFEAINMSEVLEHIPEPSGLLSLVHGRLDDKGLLCITVPNDFNPFQIALRDHLGFNDWWVAPPHHINYFDSESLSSLIEKTGFKVLHKEATFPIDMFLLMGVNYIGDDKVGRECHAKRKRFEEALAKSDLGDLKKELYKSMIDLSIGREITLFAQKC